MKSHIVALLFLILILVLAGSAVADDRLYIYTECSPGQQCIDLANGDGTTQSVPATPAQILGIADITAASVQMEANTPRALNMELSEEASKKFEKITGENIGKKLMVVFDNQILTAPTVKMPISERKIMINRGSGNQNPFWERAPWLQELIRESSKAGGRSVMVYALVAVAAAISAFAFIFMPRMRRAHPSDME